MQVNHKSTKDDVEEELVAAASSLEPYTPPPPGRTLLPAPVASAISLVTRSSSLYLQLGSFIGRLALDGARVTTLTGLEVSRAVIESILSQAGQDVAHRSTGDYGRAEAEGILERSIATLHQTVTAASFAASTGFYLSATVLGSVTDLSQQLLASLDSILGSTDSSRAISSIVTLIRREFQNPATGREGEKVGVLDLLVGICGLALLQKWCEKIVAQEIEEVECEEALWDVVTLSSGMRLDVPGSPERDGFPISSPELQIRPEGASTEDDTMDCAEMILKEKILKSLPGNASVSIVTRTKLNKTMTVEILGAHPVDLELPDGVELIEASGFYSTTNHDVQLGVPLPAYRAVFSLDTSDITGTTVVPSDSIEDSKHKTNKRLHEIPLSPSSTLVKACSGGLDQTYKDSSVEHLDEAPSLKSRSASHDNIANQKRVRRQSNVSNSAPHMAQAIRTSSASNLPIIAKRSSSKGVEKKNTFRQALKIGTPSTFSNIWPGADSRNSSQVKSVASAQAETTKHGKGSSTVSRNHNRSRSFVPSRPSSPAEFRSQLIAQQRTLSVRSSMELDSNPAQSTIIPQTPKDYAPSIYTIHTSASSTSLVLAGRGSAFDDMEVLDTLKRTGQIDGLFPRHHLVRNIARFVRFASASYGASFLRIMGIVASPTSSVKQIDNTHHHEHHSFSNHTQLPPDTILLSSFVDPAGGTDSSGETGTGVPMVHFVSLDHDSKAVVLTCRGTLGFEDILTDMTCDYDTLTYQGKEYSVHRGVHASAKRLLDGASSKVVATITAALEEFPDYGLVMCGHSLGGAVVALLAIMVSQPSSDSSSTAFVTSSGNVPSLVISTQASITKDNSRRTTSIQLPSGRPIHVYAYGPPATLSAGLRHATRGLITTIVNGQDVVPYLSLGVLHDMQAISLAFKTDDSGAKGEVRARVWEGLKGNFSDRWYNQSGPGSSRIAEDDKWAYSALKTLRASMLSSKLVPPGEVLRVESSPVLRREAFVKGEMEGDGRIGKPATRSVLRYVRNVERKFGELRFGGSMLADHSPGRYEASLNALQRGVLE